MPYTAFSPAEQSALAALVAAIIPADAAAGHPGAADPEIFADILKSGSELRDRLAVALASLDGAHPPDSAQITSFRAGFPAEAEMIQSLVAQCYYRDPRVLRTLNIAPRPPFPKGYTQIPNDLTLLEPVRARGRIYRKA